MRALSTVMDVARRHAALSLVLGTRDAFRGKHGGRGSDRWLCARGAHTGEISTLAGNILLQGNNVHLELVPGGDTAGVVSVGAGNVVSVGAGNVVSVGAGNVVSVGAGN
jgi:hypothetical protein